MPLFSDSTRARLLANGVHAARGETLDPTPVVKLFMPDASATWPWLLTELDPNDPDRAFGLCDLGLGFPELGHVSLAELEALRGPAGLRVERDAHFRPDRSLSAYADAAKAAGRIIS